MAANNYYGFTHAGTQYGTDYTASNQYASANQQYTTPVAGQGTAYPAVSNQQQAYSISGYTRPANQAGAADVLNYTAGVIAARPPSTYPTYTPTTVATSSYTGTFTQPPPPPKPATTFTNYDAAVYNAVSAYAQGAGGASSGRTLGLGFSKRGGGHMAKKGPRPPPKPQTLHYCDVCKISCAGPQTYKEHLEGQKHKKKEALMKVGGAPTVPKGSPAGLRCELCDVTCTGNDAYAAHLRGAKHQKVLKLHTKLGKPIPADNPTVIPPAAAPSGPALKKVPVAKTTFVKPAAPTKINFVSGKSDYDRFLHTDPSARPADASTVSTEALCTTYPASAIGAESQSDSSGTTTEDGNKSVGQDDYVEKDIEPVGMDYIEEIRTDDGKGFTFNCKLCDCKFNDPNAKEMHMKGRRHRLQYKKKVDPKLVVDIKPSNRQKKLDERRARTRRGFHEGFGRMAPPMPPLMPQGGPRFGMMPPNMYQQAPQNSMYYIPPLIRRAETRDDRHVMAKHAAIYPKEEELQAIQRIVSSTEKALKFVSDEIAESDSKKVNGVGETVVVKNENGVETPKTTEETTEAKNTEADLQTYRVLKGVMRVGNLAKGLLLRGDNVVQLVVLCSVKPTISLLDRVLESLPKQLQVVAPEEQYSISRQTEESGLSVKAISGGPAIEVKVTFTSPLVRVGTGEATATTVKEPADLLGKEKCLDALAALRHAKWFQARATALHSCVIIIRILRDLCNRNSAWSTLSPWVVELLTEKAISSAGISVSPGEALRIVFEVISSGVFLTPYGVGLMDPCEKDCVDALASLTRQQKIDITHHAQHALRLFAFRQVFKVLDIDELPKFKKGVYGNRKRRIEDGGVEVEEGSADQKRVNKEGEEGMETSITAGTNGTTPVAKELKK